MNDEILRPLMDLVGINTVRKNQEGYDQAAEYIVSLLERELPEATVDVVRCPCDYGGIHREVPNILAFIDVGAEKTVAFVSHYDVVDAKGPWRIKVGDGRVEFDPFKPTIIGNRLYGRGAADDKSAIIASIFATKKALNEATKNVLLVIVGDEEIGGKCGIQCVKDRVLDLADEVVVIDGRYGRIANGASGVVHAELTVRGKQGHAGYPFAARNPVHRLINILHTLIHGFVPIFGAYREMKAADTFEAITDRLSVTIIKAGLESTNIIPNEASARIDFRYVEPDPKYAEDMLRRLIIGSAIANGLSVEDVEVRIIGNHPSRYIPEEHPFVKTFKEVAEEVTGDKHEVGVERGGNDGFVFARAGVPTITYGTMLPDSNIHAPLENLRLDILEKVIDVLAEYLKR